MDEPFNYKARRQACGLSRADLAAQADRALGLHYHGRRPTIEMIDRIEQGLDVPPYVISLALRLVLEVYKDPRRHETEDADPNPKRRR